MALPFLDLTSRQTSKLNPKRGVSTHLASKEDYLEMKDRIKTPVTLQRDRTVTKLEAIEDRATGTWHFRFRFRDHSKKLRTIIVPGDIASLARTLLPQLHKAGARLPADEQGGKECRQCSHRARAHKHRPLRRPARMAGRQRRDPSVLVRKQAHRRTGQEYCVSASLRNQTSRAVGHGYQRVAAGLAAQGRSRGKKVALLRPYWSPPLLPHRSCRSRR